VGVTDSEPRSNAPIAELSLRSVLLGLILSVVMGAANVYLGLKAGMTVSASIPAAVVAMLVLRGVLRGGTVLEANQVQTAASAGESLAAGVIFTLPALVLIGVWQKFDQLTTTLIALSGGVLGVLFMIPMRKVFVTAPSKELTYPEGVACAAVLTAGTSEGQERSQARSVVYGTLLGAAFKALGSFFGVIRHTLEGAASVAGRAVYFGADISPALVAVGFIVRLHIAVLIFIGGALGWLVAIPMFSLDADALSSPLDAAWTLWSQKVRYIGVGAMLVGGVAAIVRVRHGLLSAVRELRRVARTGAAEAGEDLPGGLISTLAVAASLLIGVLYYSLTHDALIAATTTVIMVVMSFFFTAVASYIVGLVGNSNSPVSGMTITAVLFTGGLLLLFGFSGESGMLATLGVAAVVCCAACTSGDVCNDLKTGQLVGASPRRQQLMQLAGIAVASLVMAPVLQLLHDNTPGGIGGRELSAPQANLFASLARGFFGDGQLPWPLVWLGVALGSVVLALDAVLEKRQAAVRLHVMPIAVGVYLPLGLSVPILVGGLIARAVQGDAPPGEVQARLGRGVLFASGAIAGESLTGVGIALLASVGVAQLAPVLPSSVSGVLTFGAAGVAVLAFFRFSRARRAS
jgi:putative OPT family oligopeptide transporter